MDNKKIYTIQINGIKESVNAVDSLNKQLNELEQRIKNLENSRVNVKSSSGGGGSKSGLSEEEKLAKQIENIDAKRIAYSKEIYQNYLAAKDVLKETVNDQKQLASAERLQANSYSNTMNGLKEKLADLKTIHFTTDMSSDEFKQQTKDISAITEKLKELEKEYGVFSREVGNYKTATEGFDKIKVNIGGVIKEFDNLKQATKAIRDEMGTLEFNGKKDTEMYQQLEGELGKVTKAQLRLNSAMNDAKSSSKAMDDLLDTMESFGAMGQIGQGFSALFGFDNSEIEKSIQKLVALQNVMQGLEKIRKQLNTQEGIGKIFAKGNEQIDAANFTLKRLIVTMGGTGTAAKVAAVGVNLLTTAAKALASIGIVAIISAAAWAIQKVTEAVSDWVKGNADLVSSEKMLKATIESTNQTLEKELKLIEAKHSANLISSIQKQIQEENAYGKAIAQTNEELKNRLKYNTSGANSTFASYALGSKTQSDIYKDKGVTTLGGFTEAIKDSEELTKRYEALSEAVDKNTGLVYKNAKGIEIAHLSASDVKDELNHLDQMLGGNLVRSLLSFDTATEAGREGLKNFVNGIQNSDSKLYKSLLLRLPEVVSSEVGPLGDVLRAMLSQITNFVNLSNAELNKINFEGYVNSLLESADKSGKRMYDRQKKELKDRYNSLSKEEQKAQKANFEAANAALDKMQAERNKKISSNYKKEQKTVQDAEKELARLRIDAMKEGLNKTIKQLEEERRAKIAKIKLDGIMVEEMTLAVNKAIDKKIEDEKKKHTENIEKIYSDMWKNIQSQSVSNAQKELDLYKKIFDREEEFNKNGKRYVARNEGIGSYGIQGKEQLSIGTQKALGIESTKQSKLINDTKAYIDLMREASIAESEYTTKLFSLDETNAEDTELNKAIDKAMVKFKSLNTKLKETEKNLKNIYGEAFNDAKNQLLSEGYSSSLGTQIEQRIAFVDKEYTFLIEREKANRKLYDEAAIKAENESYKKISGETWNNYQKELNQADEFYKQKLELAKSYEESGNTAEAESIRREAEAEYEKTTKVQFQEYKKESELDEKIHQENLKKIDQDGTNARLAISANYYQEILQEMRDGQTAISELESKQPVINIFGFTNWKKTDANNQKLLDAYTKQADILIKKRKQLQEEFEKGLVDKDTYDAATRAFDNIANHIGQKMDETKEKMSIGNKIGTVIQEAQQYINEIGNGISTILNAVWDAQDAAYNKMIDALDKAIDVEKDKYDKMDALAEEHKNNMESIEDQIASAQGDAREHLLQRYNAEIEAQREALREKKKAEKEQEKLEKKKERMEEEQRKKEHERAVTQAIISAALATLNAYASKPFVPVGLIMGSMAAALGAAQVAIIKNQKYAEGGVLQGKSHAQGGIKVLDGTAEVEGGEYITNKVTTAKNVDLLEYINAKKRRVNLDDLIEFYGGNSSVKKNIQGVRTKFADGGQIPMLSNNIELNNGLAQAMQEYANRPTVVSVVDILNGTERVNNVKVLAGLA